jgi:hypothetical protein
VWELCGAAVVRSADLTRRLRLDLESDLTHVRLGARRGHSGGLFIGSGSRSGGAGGLVARASLEGSQQLGGSCLASAALGGDAADPGAGLAWGLALERTLGAPKGGGGGGSGAGAAAGGGGEAGGGGSGGGAAAAAPAGGARTKLGARLFCERAFGRQLLLQAQRRLGRGGGGSGDAGGGPPPLARWLDARYTLHAAGGARSAVLRCALLGGGHPESPVALSHRWRAGHSTGRGASSVDGRWSAGCSVRGPAPVTSGGGGGGGADDGGGGGGKAGKVDGGAVGGGTAAALSSSGGGTVAAAAAAAGVGGVGPGAAAARRHAAPRPPKLTLPPPQPRWEVAAVASYGGPGGAGWACLLQVLVHRGERIEWADLPGSALAAGRCF